MGKGSKRRPMTVSRKTFDRNWDAVFGKRDSRPPKSCPVPLTLTQKTADRVVRNIFRQLGMD